ncbi:hypothetical protein, variant [Aphanomyces invadans]|uniref:Paf1 complex subunit Cdc73 N-terminal domain-containing protein n=1 Tax=Aphanomyces invadans TaxID=157072 RepID=A0A024UKF3_9STRA|nr:hypothetical protein, variant [Aphanomyces invadans]ETW06789.1 hypothetical protein, variant [Aphanomyces invadans]|eukprot:XP_008864864.1 hypothetical protein, variant [Aphanomyces invadans]
MDALALVRAAVIANRPIESENGEVLLYSINMETGEKEVSHRFPATLKTTFHSKATGKSYDLHAVVTCVKYAALSFPEYVSKTRSEKATMVSTMDKKELMAYLRGDIEKSVQVYDHAEAAATQKRKAAAEDQSRPLESGSSASAPPSKKPKDVERAAAPSGDDALGETDTENEIKKRILDKEYTHCDRTSMMTTPKSFESMLALFELVLKEERERSNGSGKPTLLTQPSSTILPLHVAMKRVIPDTPIIVVPAGVSDLLSLLNVKDFLEEGHFVTTAQKKSEGLRKPASLTVHIKESDHTYTFKLVDSVIRFTSRDWYVGWRQGPAAHSCHQERRRWCHRFRACVAVQGLAVAVSPGSV